MNKELLKVKDMLSSVEEGEMFDFYHFPASLVGFLGVFYLVFFLFSLAYFFCHIKV